MKEMFKDKTAMQKLPKQVNVRGISKKTFGRKVLKSKCRRL